MRKIFLILWGLFQLYFVQAQNIGINNTGAIPDASAMLDVKSSNKGLLIPRVALTSTTDNTTILAAVTSLLIYNTASAGSGLTAVTPGFYYWNSTVATWIRLISDGSLSSSGWMLGGNTGTNPSTHFIGTTDNNSLLFKVNNQKAGYVGVGTNDGNVFWGYQTGNSNTSFSNVGIGIKSLFNNISSSNLVAIGDSSLFSNTTGPNNTGVGSKSLFTNSTGGWNSGLGVQSLYSNTTGNYNTSSGYQALFSNSTGSWNTANGLQALNANTTGNDNTANAVDALRFNTTGSANTANGYQALYKNISGNNNTAYGMQALFSNTTGSEITAIGFAALYSNTTGFGNTATGVYALYSDTSGNFNTADGYQALWLNTSGSYNSAHGHRALSSNTTGGWNTANGMQALNSNTTGSFNTANGTYALFNNTTGGINTGDGYQTLTHNTTGNSNTALGGNALVTNTTGSSNVAIGVSSLASNTTGYSNVAIGKNALYNNIDRSNLVAIGDSALFTNNSGFANTAVGSKSLFSNISGANNTAIGSSALFTNTTGINNTALGVNSLLSNTTGANNMAIGVFSLLSNISGNANSAGGIGSLYFNTTGNNNTANGFNALLFNSVGNDNTAHGYVALYSNTTGYSNVAIGTKALFSNTAGHNTVAIGDSALFNNNTSQFMASEASNNAVGSKALFSNSTGNSNQAFGGNALYSNTIGYQNAAIGSRSLYNNTQGYLNTALGDQTLTQNITGNYNTSVGGGSGYFNTTGNYNSFLGSYAMPGIGMTNLTNATAIGAQAMVSCSNCMILGSVNGVNGAASSVNVGIGTNAPTANLSISKNGTELTGNAAGTIFKSNAGVLGSSTGSEISLANIGFLSTNNSSLGIRAYRTSTGTDWTTTALLLGYDVDNTVRAGGGFLALSSNGNIGIGTVNPNAPLGFLPTLGKKITLYPGVTGDVGMAVRANLFQIYSDNPSADIAFGYDQAGTMTERMRIQANGNVGIGTASPTAKLHISSGDASLVQFGPNSFNANLFVGATPANQSGPLKAQIIASDGNLHLDPATGKNIYMGYFQQRDIYLNPSGGNVSIGTLSAPAFLLEVNGTAGKVGGGSWSVTSDARMKENVLPYTDGLSTVLSINPVKFHYNQLSGYDTSQEYVGVLAQEMKSIAPYMVGSFQKNGETYYNVDNSAMTYMLINAVKEQQLLIDKQQQQINQLQKIVEQLIKK